MWKQKPKENVKANNLAKTKPNSVNKGDVKRTAFADLQNRDPVVSLAQILSNSSFKGKNEAPKKIKEYPLRSNITSILRYKLAQEKIRKLKEPESRSSPNSDKFSQNKEPTKKKSSKALTEQNKKEDLGLNISPDSDKISQIKEPIKKNSSNALAEQIKNKDLGLAISPDSDKISQIKEPTKKKSFKALTEHTKNKHLGLTTSPNSDSCQNKEPTKKKSSKDLTEKNKFKDLGLAVKNKGKTNSDRSEEVKCHENPYIGDQKTVVEKIFKKAKDKGKIKTVKAFEDTKVSKSQKGTGDQNDLSPKNPTQSDEKSNPPKQVLSHVIDIDKDKGNIFLVTDYATQIYEYLFSLEEKFRISPDCIANQLFITPHMRSTLVDWIYGISIDYHYPIEAIQMAVGISDQYLHKVNDLDRVEYQLVGVASVFIAVKYEELVPPRLREIIYACDNAYTEDEICDMECKIFKALDFNLSRPVPIVFLRRLARAGHINDLQYSFSKYFCDLALMHPELFIYKPSEIAAASLFLSLNLFNKDLRKPCGFKSAFWTPTLQFYSKCSVDRLSPIVKKLAVAIYEAPKSELKFIYKLYSDKKHLSVSLQKELSGEIIKALVGHK